MRPLVLEVLACPIPLYVKQLESTQPLSPLLHSPDLSGQPNSGGVEVRELILVTGTSSLCFEVAAAALPISALASRFSSTDEYHTPRWQIAFRGYERSSLCTAGGC